MAAFITGLITDGGGAAGGYDLMPITEGMQPEELPSMFAGTVDHDDPSKTRQNFAMGNLFDADDGLFDDEDMW